METLVLTKAVRLLFIYCISSLTIFCQDYSKYKVVLCIYKEKKTVCIYNSPCKDSVIAKVCDNYKAGKIYGFNIIEKNDSLIKVIAWNTTNKKLIKGWIKITETAIHGRTRTDKSIYELYDKPDYNSKKTIVDSYWDCYKILNGNYKKITCNVDDFFNVLDISGKWIKVKLISKDKIYIKWLPREYQCQDITGECS